MNSFSERRSVRLNILTFRSQGATSAASTSRRAPEHRRIRKLKEGQKIYDFYSWTEVLQEHGDGGKVVVCRKKNDIGEECKYILKMRSKASIDIHPGQETYKRILLRFMNLPPHIGVLGFIEVLEDSQFIYSVMERAGGGPLLDNLLSRFTDGVVPESEMKQLMREIIDAVGHVHKQGILHRDIKPSNFVVRDVGDGSSDSPTSPRIALIDFDHSDTEYSPASPARPEGLCGTKGFNAPETYLGQNSPACDLYSVGVMLHLFMTGNLPYDVSQFEKSARREFRYADYKTISRGWLAAVYDQFLQAPLIDWDCEPWLGQPGCKDLCQSLLMLDPSQRIKTAEEALAHPWLVCDSQTMPFNPPLPPLPPRASPPM